VSATDPELPGSATPSSRGGRTRRDVSQLFEALEKKAPEQAKVLTVTLGLRLALVPAGRFVMGSTIEEQGHKPHEAPAHEVGITTPFYLGVFPVTQEQYRRVMGVNPAHFHAGNGGGPDQPVETVTWHDAVAFCKRLSEMPDEKQAGRKYRLPSEAEWEYACRAGSRTPFSLGESLSAEQANIDGQFPYGTDAAKPGVSMTTPVGTYPANLYGLHDTHGNVWEWCDDWFGGNYYAVSAKRDPQGPHKGTMKVLRGGSWRNHAATCRAAYRNAMAPHHKDNFTGFRVVCVTAI